MTHPTICIIRAEHAALSGVLQSFMLMLMDHRIRGTPPDFAVLRSMLFYVDEFPEKRHHRKESELLFPRLRARAPQLRALLDRLDHDHAQGARRIQDLQHGLLAYEVAGETRRAEFTRAAQVYVDFYLAHMALEERQVLPLAQKVLRPDDWAVLDEAFIADQDPLAGSPSNADYEELLTRIVHMVPLRQRAAGLE